ncbi:protein serine/threonine phosphatase 2C, partial [Pholiota conissans]
MNESSSESRLPPLAPGLRGIVAAQTSASDEDAIAMIYYPFSPTLGYVCIGVFDGHNGPKTAIELSKTLAEAVVGGLADLYSLHAEKNSAMDVSSGIYIPGPGDLPNPVPPDEEIDETIRKMFVAWDNVIVHEAAQRVLGLDDASYAALQANNNPDANAVISNSPVKPPHFLQDAVSTLSNAWSGSCALLGLYNIEDRSLRVAVTGDSRAVLGRRVAVDGGFKYEVHHLTADQNASNSDEAARLTTLHPDEPELLKNKRVVGWGPSRAFGDGSMKWSRAVQTRLNEEALSDRPRKECLTPPYFTAEPVVTTMKNIKKGDFAVFASDGLWDCLTSEEVVGLVGHWLEVKGMSEKVTELDGTTRVIRVPRPVENQSFEVSSSTPIPNSPNQENVAKYKTCLPSALPVDFPPSYTDNTTMYKWWKHEKKFICEDDFIGLHLMRNALGGANVDLGWALMDLQMPRARRYRDDISIIVVFF